MAVFHVLRPSESIASTKLKPLFRRSCFQIPSIRHSRAGGNPGLSAWESVGEKFPKFHILDSRLRANDAAGVDWFKPRQNRLTFRNIEFTNPTYALPMIGTLKSALVFKIHMYMFYFIKFYFLRASFKKKMEILICGGILSVMSPFGSDSFFNV